MSSSLIVVALLAASALAMPNGDIRMRLSSSLTSTYSHSSFTAWPTPTHMPAVYTTLSGKRTSTESHDGTASWPTPTYSPAYTLPTGCLSDAQATAIVSSFASLLTGPQAASFNSTANKLLADDFTDTSASIDILESVNLESVTFPSKVAFIVGQGSQPPIPTLTTLDIFNTCNKIAWRWEAFGIGSGALNVKGINTFTTNAQGQIEACYSEFNSGAWLADIGNPECARS